MTITIAHTRAEGTLVEGTTRGDGTAPILKDHRFRWSRTLGAWYLPHSRDKRADRYRIDSAAAALRAAGHDVETTIDEDTARSFADAEAERTQRAEERADRYADRANRAADNADTLLTRARDMASRIPMGQPILVGHHSENRDRRYRDRIHTTEGKGHAENQRAGYWAGRAEAAAHYEQHRTNPGTTLRRIDKLEAEARQVDKWLAGKSAGGFTRDISNLGTVAELNRRREELAEELDHWRDIIKQAEAEGFKVWSRNDFTKGDFAKIRGHWYQVLRVNAKTLTVPGGPDIQHVITLENHAYPGMRATAPYDRVTGRKSAEEMRELLAATNAPAPEPTTTAQP